MMGTSLAMAPAFLLTAGARFVDLDGPLWMEKDRDPGLIFADGALRRGAIPVWGGI